MTFDVSPVLVPTLNLTAIHTAVMQNIIQINY